MKGTYRRSHEGDYLCSRDEVRNMFADGQEIPMDSKVVEDMGLDSLNPDSVKQYRMRFSRLHDRHPWNRLQDDEFLMRLKAASRNRAGGVSPTYAGLLMFGESYRITEEFPDYFLDYREESDRSEARWLFRINSDEGDWSGNLHDFYFRIINRLDDNIAVPFVNRRDGFRVSVTKVHEALWEAVANALVHAEYKGRRGICIVRKDNKITISNPGTLRITREEFFAGGNSDPRNPALLKMFNFLNIGERAGSGVEKIFSAWREQAWPDPEYVFEYSPERVTLSLETGQIVYIPGSADLRDVPQPQGKERILLDYVKEHGSVTTSLAMELCGYKSRSAAQKLIEKLIYRKALERTGSGRQTEYVLPSDCPPTAL